MKKVLIFAFALLTHFGLMAQTKPANKKSTSTNSIKKSAPKTQPKTTPAAPKISTAPSGKEEYDITVVVKGLEKGKNAYLGYYFGDKQYLIDTVQVQENGVVRFNRAKKLPGGMY